MPGPPPGDTRDRLVAAAAALLDEGGTESVTLRDVGARIGVSRAAPYRHFRDKSGLLAAVAAADLTLLAAELDEVASRARTPATRLEAVLQGHLAWAHAHPARYRLMFSAEAYADETEPVAAAARASRGAFVAIVRDAVDAEALPRGRPERLAALLLSAVHGAITLESAGHLDGAADAEDVTRLLSRLLRATG